MMTVNQCIQKTMDFVVSVKFELRFIPLKKMFEQISVGKRPYNI